jgi:hypothetical protein
MNDSRTVVENVKAVSKSVKTEAAVETRAGGKLTSPEESHQTIAVLAYQRAESRNFASGHEMEDWLNAEAEVLAEEEGLKGFPA